MPIFLCQAESASGQFFLHPWRESTLILHCEISAARAQVFRSNTGTEVNVVLILLLILLKDIRVGNLMLRKQLKNIFLLLLVKYYLVFCYLVYSHLWFWYFFVIAVAFLVIIVRVVVVLLVILVILRRVT
jgi:hypothetical protein